MLIQNLFGNYSEIQLGYIIVGIIAFCVFIISMASFILFLVKKKKKPRRILLIISIIMLFLYLFCGMLLFLSNTGEFGAILDPDVGFEKIWGTVTYENKNCKDVVYDRNGKEYTYRQYLNGFSYYDKDGNECVLTTISDYNQHQQLEYIKHERAYDIPDRMISTDFYISEDGYIYYWEDIPPTETVGSSIAEYEMDENGNRFFDWTIVSWDSNGKMYYFNIPIDELSQYDSNDYI